MDEIAPTGNSYDQYAATWRYTSATHIDIYAQSISGELRQPNGNTLTCEGPDSDFVEVTDYGEIVWEYNAGSALLRIEHYASDYAGFIG